MRKAIHTVDAPLPQGPYSQAIVSEGLVFVAGQGPINKNTNEFELGDIRSETRLTLGNIKAILAAAGSSLQDVVKVGVFLSNLTDFSAMNEIYREFFPQDPPARTTIGAQLPRIKIEIDCIAKLSKPKKKRAKVG